MITNEHKNSLWKMGITLSFIFISLSLIWAYRSHSDKKARNLFYTQEMYRFYEHNSYLISCWLGTNEYGITMDNEEFQSEDKRNNEEIELLRRKMHEDGYSHWEITKIEKAALQVLEEQKEFSSKSKNAEINYFDSPETKLLHPEGTYSPGTVINEWFSSMK